MTRGKIKNDCFALPAGVDWTPIDKALETLDARISRCVEDEVVPVAEAAGRILSDDVSALRSNPPGANAAVDGYGFAGGGGAHKITLRLVAGRAVPGAPFDGHVPEGHAIRILTGALLPEGIDTVVLEEDVETSDGAISFVGPIRRGANARAMGEDVVQGSDILQAGRTLTSGDIALLTATGHARVTVRRRLRVGVLSTGSELTDPRFEAPSDKTFDTNRPMLTSILERWGHEVVDLGRVGDTAVDVRGALNLGAASAHAILTSGGASASEEDHMSAVLTAAGTMFEWRIAVKPGRPLALAVWDGVPVFGLPGNPVAAFVCSVIFARPALAKLAGGPFIRAQSIVLPAGFQKTKKAGRTEYLRARLRGGVVQCFSSEGSGRISGLSWAEGLVELPEEAMEIKEGSPVRYIPFGHLGL